MLDKLNKITGASKENIMKKAAAVIDKPVILCKPEEVWRNVADFNPTEGWLCLTDEVVIIRGNYDLQQYQNRFILSGELLCGSKSLHIRQDQDSFILTTISRHEDTGEQIMFEESYLAVPGRNINKLTYEIYWHIEDDNDGKPKIMRPYAARFAGFKASTDKKEASQ